MIKKIASQVNLTTLVLVFIATALSSCAANASHAETQRLVRSEQVGNSTTCYYFFGGYNSGISCVRNLD